MASQPPTALPRAYQPAIAAIDYPPSFPWPDRAPYSYAVDMGLIRSAMAAGNSRQRRVYKHMPHTFALTFHMDTKTLFVWQQWVNFYAYDWFNLPLADMYSGYSSLGGDADLVTYQAARFISDLNIAADGWDRFSVTVAAELNYGLSSLLPDLGDTGWIVGGTPLAPSPDLVVAGSPGPFPFALSYNFLGYETLDPGITVAGGANGTRVNSAGLIVAGAAPRFDYDPVTRTPRGLLIEEARTNRGLQSAAFETGAWGKYMVLAGTNVAVAPDGAMTADKIIANATTNYRGFYQVMTGLAPTATYTYSMYFKAAEFSKIALTLSDTGANSIAATFDLAAGTATPRQAGTGVVAGATITAAGNGWWRCTVSGVPATAGANSQMHVDMMDNTGNGLFPGDNVSGVLLWGAQLEAGAFATSYIPTVAAAVARTADVLTVTGTNFSSWFNQAAGTFLVRADGFSQVAGSVLFEVDDGTVNSRHLSWITGGAINTLAIVAGAPTAVFALGNAAALVPFTVAYTYAADSFAASRDGGAVATDTAGAVPPGCNRLLLGSAFGGLFMNSHLQSFAYMPRRVSNAELQQLSAGPVPLATYGLPPMPLNDWYLAGTPAFPAAKI